MLHDILKHEYHSMIQKEIVYKPTQAQIALRKIIRDKTRILAYGGSRSGKTFEFCRALIILALRYGGRYAIFRRYYNAVYNSVFSDTFPKVMRLCFPGVPYRVNKSLSAVFFEHNGAEIYFVGLDDDTHIDKILGREYAAIYFNECSEISFRSIEIASTRLAQKVYDPYTGAQLRNRIFFDCNPPGKSHWSYKMFIEGVHPVSRVRIANHGDYGMIQINPYDNLENLPEGYVENTLASASERSKRRFLYGEYSDENENALWKLTTMIDPFRVVHVPSDLERVVVGVDPAVTSSESSDSTGIVVCGMKHDHVDQRDHFYVLDDLTVSAPPRKWSAIAAEAYEKWDADVVVAEVNQGGDLVETTLLQAAPNLPVKKVRASRGKILRAEPISVMYVQGRVHHVGEFKALEDEMTSYTGGSSESSPDRLDALVWALTELSNEHAGSVDGGNLYFG